jgi:UDP-N-acetylglucosamine 2-epimerase
MGERPDTILGTGCPSSDIARRISRQLTPEIVNARGNGVEIDVAKPFLLVIFHPTTTEYGGENRQIQVLLSALDAVQMPTLLLWPNIDAGADHISKTIRIHRNQAKTPWLRTLTNLTPEDYLKVLANATCAVGNSSSFVRDASYFGTPVVLVGNRQNGRETDEHVTRVPVEMDRIVGAIRAHLAHGRFQPSTLYGDGNVSERIAEAIERLTPYRQKQLAFTLDGQECNHHAPP